MNAIAYGYDQQVHVIIAKHQELARQAAQVRLANDEASAHGSITSRVRAVLGGMMITLGERLNPDAGRLPELEPATQA